MSSWHLDKLVGITEQVIILHAAQTQGRAADNRIRPDELNEVERRILKEAFRQARKLQQRLKLDYQI